MKKNIFTSFMLVGFSVALLSCQKEMSLETPSIEDGQTFTHLVTVNENAGMVSCKSSFIENEGIRMSGNETLAVFYGDAVGSSMSKADVKSVSERKYSVSHPTLDGVSAYRYWFVIPDNGSVAVVSPNSTEMRLPSVQFPGQNTFDPSCDLLIGKSMENVQKVGIEFTVDQLKRLSWPFIIDVNNDFNGEKINAVTLQFEGAENQVAGTMEVSHSSNFNEITVKNIKDPSNSVAAVYPNGLVSRNGKYSVWFMLKAGQLAGKMVMTVTTATKTYRTSVELPAEMEVKEMFNRKNGGIVFDESTATESVFADLSAGGLNLDTYSVNGNNNWEFNGCEVYKGKNGINGVKMNAGATIRLPEYYGKMISRIRVYYHPENITEPVSFKEFTTHIPDPSTESAPEELQTFIIENMDNSIISAISYELVKNPWWRSLIDTEPCEFVNIDGVNMVRCNSSDAYLQTHMPMGKGKVSVSFYNLDFVDDKDLALFYITNSASYKVWMNDVDAKGWYYAGTYGDFIWDAGAVDSSTTDATFPLQKFELMVTDSTEPGKYKFSVFADGKFLCAHDGKSDPKNDISNKAAAFQIAFSSGSWSTPQEFTVSSFCYEPYK